VISLGQKEPRRLAPQTLASGSSKAFLGLGILLVAGALGGLAALVIGRDISNLLAAGSGALIILAVAGAVFAFRGAMVASVSVRWAISTAMLEDVDGRLVTDPSGSVIFANAAFRAMAGATDRRTPPLAAAFDHNQDTRDRLTRLAARASAGATSREDFIVTQIGVGRRWLGVVGYPLAGMPGHVVWSVADVTAEREVAKAARDELGRLADFFDHAPVGLFSVDLEGRFRLVNEVLARWLEQDPDRMVADGVLIDDFIRPADSTKVLPKSWAEQWEGEVKLVSPSGEIRPVYISQGAAFDGDSPAVHTRSVARDLSEERELEETLRRAEEGFRRFFDFAPVGIVMVDGAGEMVETNAAFRTMAKEQGVESAQALFLDLIDNEDRENVDTLMRQSRAGNAEDDSIDVAFIGPGERTGQLFIRRTGEGLGDDLIVYIVDTTEQKKLEVQFAQSQKMQAVGQLAGGIAHDFNNLLTAMIGYSDLLLLHHQPGDQDFADIMQIKQNANRAANLVRQLLAFSRRQTLNATEIDLTDVLAELVNLVRRLIGEHIELDMIHGRDLGTVMVDQGQLEQVIINMAVNARDAMPDGGKLTIQTFNRVLDVEVRLQGFDVVPPGDYVAIELTDSGVGIDPDNLVKIFEPFYTTKKVGEGTGLGLSTVFGIIKQTGGFIIPESHVGEGTVFRIYFPRYVPTADELASVGAKTMAAVSEENAVQDLTGKAVVLLVEDEAPVRRFASRALENKGYTVLQAASAEEALDLLEDHEGSIDLVITDVVMPGMDGPSLVAIAQTRRPGLKVIFISGYAQEVFESNLKPGLEYSFLPKPFSLKELASRVKEVLAP
jgi:two-component system cell cycle sensor histidine kinase/response regulator CckA